MDLEENLRALAQNQSSSFEIPGTYLAFTLNGMQTEPLVTKTAQSAHGEDSGL